MTVLRTLLLAAVTAWSLTSCAGYRLGSDKPQSLAHVRKIYVPLAKNATQTPRAAAFTTNNIVDALLRDGTYQVGGLEDSQAVLNVELFEINYGSIRNARENRLRPVELAMTVQLRWSVVDAANSLKVLDSGTSQGRTTLFVDPNLQTARQTVLNDALQRASTSLVSRLADGF